MCTDAKKVVCTAIGGKKRWLSVVYWYGPTSVYCTRSIGPPTSSSFELTCIYYCKSNSARNLSVIYTRQDGLEWENEAACVDYASHEKETRHDF